MAKAIGHPIVKYASLLMSGKLLSEINFTEEPTFSHVCVKEVVVPWRKFQGGWVGARMLCECVCAHREVGGGASSTVGGCARVAVSVPTQGGMGGGTLRWFLSMAAHEHLFSFMPRSICWPSANIHARAHYCALAHEQ